MARAPETGFYFEPLAERLALLVEGMPFPSDDHWAYVGDPAEMTEALAKLECATRWPGVDPEALGLELPTRFELADAPGPGEAAVEGLDIDQLLQQAEAWRETAERIGEPDRGTIGEAIARARKPEH